MKFRLATLFWLGLVVAVIITAWSKVQRERRLCEEKIAAAMALAESVQQQGFNALAEANYYRRSLGLLPESLDRSQPYVFYVRPPQELGGLQSHRLPATWYWRLSIPKIDELEICLAMDNIPPYGATDEWPKTNVMSFSPDLKSKTGRRGLAISDDSTKLNLEEPVEVLLIVRLERAANKGVVHLDLEISQPHGTICRGKSFPVSEEQSEWILDQTLGQLGGGLFGLSVDSKNSVPYLEQAFSLMIPLPLLQIRANRKLGEFKYERVEGPSNGLMIWLQKKGATEQDEGIE
ncbi:MAG: hypothetical protein KF851_09195 [Pirellulaceae bacterium]|jgi:hypothetical protein|nr:hypothetical protein [Pirellulaceae bacterium]